MRSVVFRFHRGGDPGRTTVGGQVDLNTATLETVEEAIAGLNLKGDPGMVMAVDENELTVAATWLTFAERDEAREEDRFIGFYAAVLWYLGVEFTMEDLNNQRAGG